MSVMRFFCCNLPFLKDFFTHFPLVAGKQPIPAADDGVILKFVPCNQLHFVIHNFNEVLLLQSAYPERFYSIIKLVTPCYVFSYLR